MQMVAHGLSIAASFIISEFIYEGELEPWICLKWEASEEHVQYGWIYIGILPWHLSDFRACKLRGRIHDTCRCLQFWYSWLSFANNLA